MEGIASTPDFVNQAYTTMQDKLRVIKDRVRKPLTLTDKILLSHLKDPTNQELQSNDAYLQLSPDRLALQDVTGQMAILQFIQSSHSRVTTPTTVHCDHLIQARTGGASDTAAAITENHEVFDFLRSAANKFGIGFWGPGSGIIHQVILENYAFPGGLFLGTDSHTPNAGGLATLAIGVGGADGAEVMTGLPFELKYPRHIGVRLVGKLQGWSSPKDVILYLAGILSVSGATNSIIEYFGEGCRAISCTGKATICNMGAELGATGSIFPYDEYMERYLIATGRQDLANLANENVSLLTADTEVETNPENYFNRVIQINLSELEPHVVGPHTPDLCRPISQFQSEIREKGYEDQISCALIGSCTNSSYEDMTRASDVAKQALKHNIKAAVPLLVTPGSEQIRATIDRDGQAESLRAIGGNVMANACGPCIGQWKRTDVTTGEKNSIVTSFNRNFPRRNDGAVETMNFIASPEIVTAFSLAGRLSFNPLTDSLIDTTGSPFKLTPPEAAPDVPINGFDKGESYYEAPDKTGEDVNVVIQEDSSRLQFLKPFEPWDGKDIEKAHILLKAKGKCTTDHISPAGPWLRFRGHIENLSDNMFLGAVNAYTGQIGTGLNQSTGQTEQSFSDIAKSYKSKGVPWVVIGDTNYGEGSSREHAALSPRFLGATAVVAKSFARIHESNLKKQGLLTLLFAEPSDYDMVQEGDRISLIKLSDLAPGKPIVCILHHANGTENRLTLNHTFNSSQLDWFRAGSAMNIMRDK